MKNQTYIVTGGNAGIGLEIARELAAQNLHVVLISRDAQKGATAVADIQQSTGNTAVECLVGDLSTIASTHQLATALLERYPHLTVLINNAGVWMTHKQLNADGLEQSFMVNHMAPFILSHRLLARLQQNQPARIVNVNAGLYVNGQIDLAKTPYGGDFGRIKSYATTKLCNVLFTRQFAQQIAGSGVTINAVHPGVIRTDLGNSKGIIGWLLRLVKRSWSTPAEGAAAPVWLATAAEVGQINGRYFDQKTEIPYHAAAENEALSQELWALSLKLAQLETFA